MRALIGGVAVLALAAAAGGQDKKDEKKDEFDAKRLVGRWEAADPKKPVVLEFAEKEKFSLTVTLNGKPEKSDGTFKLAGNKLELVVKVAGEDRKETVTLSRLTDDDLVGTGSDGKEDAYKRVRPKK